MLAGLLLLCFFPFPEAQDKFFWGPLSDAFHYPMFFVLSAALFYITGAGVRTGAKLALFLLLLAALIELAQPFFGRSESAVDFLVGAAGVFAGWGAVLVVQHGLRVRLLYLLFVALVLGTLLLPAWFGLETLIWRGRNFPVLARFEERRELNLWTSIVRRAKPLASLALSSEIAAEGRYSLRVSARGGHWSGVEYKAGLLNWSPYGFFAFDLYNPTGDVVNLYLRIDDPGPSWLFNDRFTERIPAAPGWNAVRVSLEAVKAAVPGHSFDLTRVRRLLFFLDKEEPDRVFYLDRLRLEREE